MAIISSSNARLVRPNFFGAKAKGDDSWLEALPVDVIRADGKHNGRTTDGVWVSAGASYGAQVEFRSFAERDEFVASHKDTSRPAVGTRAARIVADDAVTFVAAYNAAVGKEVEVGALVAPTADDAAEFQAWKAWKASQKK